MCDMTSRRNHSIQESQALSLTVSSESLELPFLFQSMNRKTSKSETSTSDSKRSSDRSKQSKKQKGQKKNKEPSKGNVSQDPIKAAAGYPTSIYPTYNPQGLPLLPEDYYQHEQPLPGDKSQQKTRRHRSASPNTKEGKPRKQNGTGPHLQPPLQPYHQGMPPGALHLQVGGPDGMPGSGPPSTSGYSRPGSEKVKPSRSFMSFTWADLQGDDKDPTPKYDVTRPASDGGFGDKKKKKNPFKIMAKKVKKKNSQGYDPRQFSSLPATPLPLRGDGNWSQPLPYVPVSTASASGSHMSTDTSRDSWRHIAEAAYHPSSLIDPNLESDPSQNNLYSHPTKLYRITEQSAESGPGAPAVVATAADVHKAPAAKKKKKKKRRDGEAEEKDSGPKKRKRSKKSDKAEGKRPPPKEGRKKKHAPPDTQKVSLLGEGILEESTELSLRGFKRNYGTNAGNDAYLPNGDMPDIATKVRAAVPIIQRNSTLATSILGIFLPTLMFSLFATQFAMEKLIAIRDYLHPVAFMCFGIFGSVLSPYLASESRKLPSKLLLCGGLFAVGIAGVITGVVLLKLTGAVLEASLIVLACIVGLGIACIYPSAWAAAVYVSTPEIERLVIASIVVAFATACTIGPIFGYYAAQALYLRISYWVIGSVILVLGFFAVPCFAVNSDQNVTGLPPTLRLRTLLTMPHFWLLSVMTWISTSCNVFFALFLWSRIVQVTSAPLTLGIMMIILLGLMMLAGGVTGFFIRTSWAVIAFDILNVIGFLLIGPLPILNLSRTNIYAFMAGAIILSIALVPQLVLCCKKMYKVVWVNEYSQEIQSITMLSGLISSEFFIGILVGGAGGVAGIQSIGYGWMTTIFLFMQLIQIALYVVLRFMRASPSYKKMGDRRFLDDDRDRQRLTPAESSRASFRKASQPISSGQPGKRSKKAEQKQKSMALPDINSSGL